MVSNRDNTRPDPAPPGPAPPGPLPCPPGPPAPYEQRPYEWDVSSDITSALEAHKAALARGHERYSRAHHMLDPLLAHDEVVIARSVKSSLKLCKYLIRQSRRYKLYVEPEVRNAISCYHDAVLPACLRPPHADTDSRFQHYLTALERLSEAAQTLHLKLKRYQEMHPSRRSSRGRTALPASPQAIMENFRNTVIAATASDPPQILDANFTSLQWVDPGLSYVPTNALENRAASSKKEKKTDLAAIEGDRSALHSTKDASLAKDCVKNSTLNESGISVIDFAQKDEPGAHLRGGFVSTMDLPAFSETSKDTYPGAFFELLLTMRLNRIEYPEGEVTKFGAGESYRPIAHARPRSPPGGDTFRSDRDRSPRRDRARSPPISDSYHPGAYCQSCLYALLLALPY